MSLLPKKENMCGTVLQFDQVIFKYALLRIEKNAFVTEEHIFGIEIVEFID